MTAAGRDATGPTLAGAFGFSETVVEVGAAHPGVRHVMQRVGGTTGFLVALDGDRMTDVEVEIGLGHRGFEKEVESEPWHRALTRVARLGHVGGVQAEVAYCLAVETLAGVELPDRAVWLRMMACEASRVADHFVRLSALASAIEIAVGQSIAEAGAVAAAGLLQTMTGCPPFGAWIRLGGVASMPGARLADRWSETRDHLERILARFESAVVGNPTCESRLRGVARLSVDECLARGVTGPALRAAGSATDLRRDVPYLAYASVDFEVPIGTEGDNLDRLLVVVHEIRESLRIIDHAEGVISSLGPGALCADLGGSTPSARTDPEIRAAFDLDGPSIPAGEARFPIEASTGELGFFVVSDGGRLPRRIRCRAPSFFHAGALAGMLRGQRFDDLLPTVALLHLVSGECDR
ncbi:MAG TPA: hypothetical protein ENI85_16365 [Deltaproteobacteria bacterium]|nr:hypothetical protein [Deltaproteobacteria bacterium]